MNDIDDTAERQAVASGAWYLEMLGVEVIDEPATPEVAPPRSETAELVFELDTDQDSMSTPTPLEPPTREQPAVPMSLESGDEPDLGDWRPNELARQVGQKRNFRWSLVITAAVLLAVVVAAWLWLPTTVTAEAEEEAADYVAVIEDLRDLLPEAQQALAAATDPATEAINLFPLSAQLTRLDAASGEVIARAARPLPDTLPLASRGPLEDLEPTRTAMKALGETGMAIVGRMADTITYRTSLDGILVYPSLPVRADPSQINGLSVAETQATSESIEANLPRDPAFDAHRFTVAKVLDEFSAWQTRYLDALRSGDEAETASLIDNLTTLRGNVFVSLVPALATIRSEVDAMILDLNADTTATISSMPR